MNKIYKTSKKSMDKIKIACGIAILLIWLFLITQAEFTLLTVAIGIVCSLLIPFGVIMIFNYPKNTKTELNSKELIFHVLAAENSPFVFRYSEIDKIVIGTVKSSFHQNRFTIRKYFGIEMQQSEELEGYKVHYLYSFPIKHLDNYKELIKDIENYCKENNVPFEKTIG